ncbi:hypothetical protein MHU86_377 [Fragilaria crotonensis]|nr:hypothetical protein MHU86_377 [Fragilaria crotonensis]
MYEDTWSPCASARGVKLFIATICASRRSVKSADFIGAYLQAKVIGRHFVKLPLEYAYHFPEYAKFFGSPMLLNKGIYGLVYSGKYWNIEFSNGSTPKALSNLLPNRLILSDTTNTINGSVSYFSSMICSTLEATIPSKNNLKIPSAIASMSNSSTCAMVPPNAYPQTPDSSYTLINTATF